MKLTQALVEDFDAVLEFVHAYYTYDQIAIRPQLADGVRTLLADPQLGRVWFITADAQRIGYVVLTFGYDHEFGGKTGLITDLYISEEFRGAGLGTCAFAEILGLARSFECNIVELVVTPHNSRVPEFYNRMGLSLSDRRTYSVVL